MSDAHKKAIDAAGPAILDKFARMSSDNETRALDVTGDIFAIIRDKAAQVQDGQTVAANIEIADAVTQRIRRELDEVSDAQ